jgi:hypothetical protein
VRDYEDVKKRKKKKMEFSQKVCIIGLAMVAFMLVSNVALAYLGRQPLNDITVACVSCFGGFATGGYYTLAGARHASLNKRGLTVSADGGASYVPPPESAPQGGNSEV